VTPVCNALFASNAINSWSRRLRGREQRRLGKGWLTVIVEPFLTVTGNGGAMHYWGLCDAWNTPRNRLRVLVCAVFAAYLLVYHLCGFMSLFILTGPLSFEIRKIQNAGRAEDRGAVEDMKVRALRRWVRFDLFVGTLAILKFVLLRC
jgi:hypothetical protein